MFVGDYLGEGQTIVVNMNARLRWARTHGTEKQLLLELPSLMALPHPSSTTPMMLAASLGMYDTVRALLDAGVSVEAMDSKGWSALRYALSRSERMPRDVLERLATPITVRTPTQPFQWTALMVAASRGDEGAVERLLDLGAECRHKSSTGEWNAMRLAALNGHAGCLRRLHAANGRLSTIRVIHPRCELVVHHLVLNTRLRRAIVLRTLIDIPKLHGIPTDVCRVIVNYVFESM